MAWLNRIYNWVTDRNNGVPITASRMDAEFDNIVSAVNTLHSGIPDAEWVPESSIVAYVSAFQFKVTGVDVTSVYHPGRRVKIIHNGGVATIYGTVESSSFSTDTTVIVQTDTGADILSTVTAVSYGLLSFVNPSYLSPGAIVMAYVTPSYNYTGGVEAEIPLTSYIDTDSWVSGNTVVIGQTGYYMVNAQVAADIPLGGTSQVYIHSSDSSNERSSWGTVPVGGAETVGVTTLIPLAAGEVLSLHYYADNDATIGSGRQNSYLTLVKIR